MLLGLQVYNETNTTEAPYRMTRTTAMVAGMYMMCICLIGTLTNLTVIGVIQRHPDVLNSNIRLVKYLCAGKLFIALFGFPFVSLACVYNSWIFGSLSCNIYGFLMTSIAFTTMALLASIAVQRFITIATMKTSFTPNASSGSAHTRLCLVCLTFGVSLAALPTVGFGKYGQEIGFVTCAPVWWSTENYDFEYTLLILIAVFLVPVTLIILSYVGIFIKVRMASGSRLNNSQHSKYQLRLAVVVILLIAFFLASWGPYAVVCMIQMFNGRHKLPPTAFIFPILLAKSSVIWDPLIYAMGCTKFRQVLWNDLGILKTCIYTSVSTRDDRERSSDVTAI